MKNTIFVFALLFATYSGFSQQTFCLQFSNPTVSGGKVSFDLQISAPNDGFLLGSSNLQFSYDNTKVSNPSLVSSPLAIPSYQPPVVTDAVPGQEASLNIEAPFTSSGFGENITTTPFTVARVEFDIVNSSNPTDFSWAYNGGTTQTVVNTNMSGTVGQIFAMSSANTCLQPLLNQALPITLSSFTAKSVNNKDAHLDWVTESEINGSHFELERSENGVDFEQIATIQATGDAHTAQDYSYIDENANDYTRNDVVKYYRIKMVDLDGEYKYSGIRAVNFTRSIVEFSLEIFPNPTVDQVQISLEGIDNTSTERPMLQIFNSNGALIRSQELDSDLGKIDMKDMPKMVYHFIVNYNNQKHVNKVIKL